MQCDKIRKNEICEFRILQFTIFLSLAYFGKTIVGKNTTDPKCDAFFEIFITLTFSTLAQEVRGIIQFSDVYYKSKIVPKPRLYVMTLPTVL